MLRSYTITGGIVGAGGYFFMNNIWMNNSSRSIMFDYITGYGIMGSLGGVCFVHPRFMIPGAILGGLSGE